MMKSKSITHTICSFFLVSPIKLVSDFEQTFFMTLKPRSKLEQRDSFGQQLDTN